MTSFDFYTELLGQRSFYTCIVYALCYMAAFNFDERLECRYKLKRCIDHSDSHTILFVLFVLQCFVWRT